jgi:hypothetical protein
VFAGVVLALALLKRVDEVARCSRHRRLARRQAGQDLTVGAARDEAGGNSGRHEHRGHAHRALNETTSTAVHGGHG